MRAAIFYIKQTLVLGTISALLLFFVLWGWAGPFLIVGGWAILVNEWLLALAATAVFLIFFVTPLQLLFRRFGFGWLSLLAGVLTGPIAVVLALLILGTPRTFYFFVTDALFLHVLLTSVGVVFAFNFQRWLGHNISLNL